MKIINNELKQVIELEETEDLIKLENQLMLLGMNGLFYSPYAREIQNKINRISGRQNVKM